MLYLLTKLIRQARINKYKGGWCVQIHEVSSYVTWNIPLPQFYIQDILPKQGVMLLYGNPKVRKSWLSQYMAFCISLGIECLGFRTEQARVLIAQFEISSIAYAWRLKNMARNFELQQGMLYETSPMLMYIDEEENFNRFAGAIRPYQPKVIVLDCLAACFGGDENDSRDMARLIEKINMLKVEHEASVILVHHTNKNLLSISSVDRVRGHSKLTGWVDTLAYMCEQPTGVQLQIKARQASRELRNINIVFENYLWHVA